MGVSHCVVLRSVLHQVVSDLVGQINKCVLLCGTCPTGLPPTMGGGRGHLVREEELGLAELKVTLVALRCYHGAVLSWSHLTFCI